MSSLWQRAPYPIDTAKAAEKRLSSAHFVLHTAHSAVFAEDVDPPGAEWSVPAGPGIHEQVVRLAPTVVRLGAQQAIEVSAGIVGRGCAVPLCLRAAVAIRVQGVRRSLVFEHLL